MWAMGLVVYFATQGRELLRPESFTARGVRDAQLEQIPKAVAAFSSLTDLTGRAVCMALRSIGSRPSAPQLQRLCSERDPAEHNYNVARESLDCCAKTVKCM